MLVQATKKLDFQLKCKMSNKQVQYANSKADMIAQYVRTKPTYVSKVLTERSSQKDNA